MASEAPTQIDVLAELPALQRRVDRADLEWGFAQMSARLDRQLAQVDGLDTKAGIFFAYTVALIAGSAAIDVEGLVALARMAAIAYGLVGLCLYFDALRVRDFRDAPSAEAIDLVSRDPEYDRGAILTSFMGDQIGAIKENRRVIDQKVGSLHVAHFLAGAATIALIVQVLGKGVIR